MRAFWVTTLVLFLVDQASKWVVVQYMNLKELGALDILPPFVNFRMAWNEGVNFGLFSSDNDYMRWVLIAVAVVISIAVVYWVYRDRMSFWPQIAAGFLVGGAIGNIVDRVIYGAVADFLNMSCCGFQNPFSFNVADIAIFVGAFGLIWLSDKRETPKTP